MKILVISNDKKIMNSAKKLEQNDSISSSTRTKKMTVHTFGENVIPLEIVTYAFSVNPGVLIIDNDLVKPNSVAIIKSFRDMRPDTSVIFITSDPSVELGREVSRLGILYYGIKPLLNSELEDSIISIANSNKIKITNYQ